MSLSNSAFISYRRSTSAFIALAVYQDFHANGIDVFYDIESIESGQFDTIILNQIAARPYFLPILTPKTLERCVEPGDWLLREIEQALRCKRMVVPLYTPDFEFHNIDTFLPNHIAPEFKRYNAVVIPQRYFRWAMQDVRERFLKPVDIPTTPTPKRDIQIVARKLAKAATAPIVTEEQIASIYSGTDRTASELAIQRLRGEIRELERALAQGQSAFKQVTGNSTRKYTGPLKAFRGVAVLIFILTLPYAFGSLFQPAVYGNDGRIVTIGLWFLSLIVASPSLYYWIKLREARHEERKIRETNTVLTSTIAQKRAELSRHEEIVKL